MVGLKGRARLTHRARFGERLRELRLARGLTQERLAEIAGLHKNYVGEVERGLRNVGLDNIVLIARALKVSPDQFFKND